MSNQLLGQFILCLAGVGLSLVIYDFAQTGWTRIHRTKAIMWIWVALYTGFLLVAYKVYAPRHILPVVPFLIILSTEPMVRLLHHVRSRRFEAPVAIVATLVLLTAGGFEVGRSWSNMLEFRESVVSREQTSSSVRVGEWLRGHYPASTRVLYDAYSYIPPFFDNVLFTWGGTFSGLATFDPQVIVVNQSIADIFSDMDKATQHYKGEKFFRERYEYYGALREQEIGYKLVRDFGGFQVYEKD